MIIFSAWLTWLASKQIWFEILRIFALNQPYIEITDGGANDSTNDTDIDDDTELIIELPSCVKTVNIKKGVKKMILQVQIERSE